MEVVELINIEGQEGDESKYLTTKLVLDWRFRDADGFQLEEGEDSKAVSTERCWQRRSRLVAREYKTVEKRDDVFSPATSPALTKIIPMLCLAYNWSIWSGRLFTGSPESQSTMPYSFRSRSNCCQDGRSSNRLPEALSVEA